jgi:hypothetical protein
MHHKVQDRSTFQKLYTFESIIFDLYSKMAGKNNVTHDTRILNLGLACRRTSLAIIFKFGYDLCPLTVIRICRQLVKRDHCQERGQKVHIQIKHDVAIANVHMRIRSQKRSRNIEGSTYRATHGTGSIKMRVSAQAAIQTEAIGASDELLLVFHHININMFILSVGVSKAFY